MNISSCLVLATRNNTLRQVSRASDGQYIAKRRPRGGSQVTDTFDSMSGALEYAFGDEHCPDPEKEIRWTSLTGQERDTVCNWVGAPANSLYRKPTSASILEDCARTLIAGDWDSHAWSVPPISYITETVTMVRALPAIDVDDMTAHAVVQSIAARFHGATA